MTSFYIHYPYCKSKCPYCDFNSHVRDNIDFVELELAYKNEIKYFSQNAKDKKISSIFFGGGTPSLMPIKLVEKILEQIFKEFEIAKDCEISLEANPTSSEAQKFADLKKIGVNRLSIGIQALNDVDLKFLGREHSALEALKTIEVAHKIFDNFSFDLIYARPKQKIKDWVLELENALEFNSKHLSLYQLTIEKGTKFFSQFSRGEFVMPDDILASEFYQITNEIMVEKGFKHYEISNYAQKNFECRHNLSYWQSDDYIGVGAGAHSRVYFKNNERRQAVQMLAEPLSWMKGVQKSGAGIQKISSINEDELFEEIVMMGLRLECGTNIEVFAKHFLSEFKNFYEIFAKFNLYKNLEFLLKNNLVEIENNNLFIPPSKRILTNSIIEKLLI